jgi:virginiamycin B lyase
MKITPRRACSALGATLALLLVAAPTNASASSQAGTITEYALPAGGGTPCEVEFAADGAAWVQEIATGRIDRINPTTGHGQAYYMPGAATTTGGMDLGPDGAIWMVELANNQIVRIDTSTGHMTTYPLPWGALPTSQVSLPAGIALDEDLEFGDDGDAWFTMVGLNAIGRLNITTGALTKYQIPTPLSGPLIIKQGPPGTMAFTETTGNKIGLINESSGTIREFPVSTPASVPLGVTTGPDGMVWYAEAAGQALVVLNPANGQTTRYPLPAAITVGNPLPFPGPLKFGTDGNLYVAQGGFFGGNVIGQFNPQTHAYKQFATPTPISGPCDLTNEIPGQIAFGEFTGNRLGILHY